MLDEQTYLMHRLALEGWVFYRNNLAEPQYVKTYFPPSPGQQTYERDPHLSLPVTSEIIDRIASLLHGGMSIELEGTTEVEDTLAAIQERNDWPEFSRDLLVKAMGKGNHLVLLRTPLFTDGVYFETWSGEWLFREKMMGYEWLGYMYITDPKTGEIRPVIQKPTREEERNLTSVWIDDVFWNGVPHNFGFMPAVLMRSVDKDDDDRYGRAFYLRFRDPLVRYNQVFSQILKAITILQNVWKTNKDFEDPNKPLRLNPDTINFLGENGMLEQAARELNLEPEFGTLERLKQHIASSADVPDFMTGLNNVGKVESGVALNIVSGPLKELCKRIVLEYKPKVEEILTKAVQAEFAMRGRRAPAFTLTLNMTENILPVDKEKELGMAYQAKTAGIFTADELRPIIGPLLGLPEEVYNKPMKQEEPEPQPLPAA